jgi:hypothetical protein
VFDSREVQKIFLFRDVAGGGGASVAAARVKRGCKMGGKINISNEKKNWFSALN